MPALEKLEKIKVQLGALISQLENIAASDAKQSLQKKLTRLNQVIHNLLKSSEDQIRNQEVQYLEKQILKLQEELEKIRELPERINGLKEDKSYTESLINNQINSSAIHFPRLSEFKDEELMAFQSNLKRQRVLLNQIPFIVDHFSKQLMPEDVEKMENVIDCCDSLIQTANESAGIQESIEIENSSELTPYQLLTNALVTKEKNKSDNKPRLLGKDPSFVLRLLQLAQTLDYVLNNLLNGQLSEHQAAEAELQACGVKIAELREQLSQPMTAEAEDKWIKTLNAQSQSLSQLLDNIDPTSHRQPNAPNLSELEIDNQQCILNLQIQLSKLPQQELNTILLSQLSSLQDQLKLQRRFLDLNDEEITYSQDESAEYSRSQNEAFLEDWEIIEGELDSTIKTLQATNYSESQLLLQRLVHLSKYSHEERSQILKAPLVDTLQKKYGMAETQISVSVALIHLNQLHEQRLQSKQNQTALLDEQVIEENKLFNQIEIYIKNWHISAFKDESGPSIHTTDKNEAHKFSSEVVNALRKQMQQIKIVKETTVSLGLPYSYSTLDAILKSKITQHKKKKIKAFRSDSKLPMKHRYR